MFAVLSCIFVQHDLRLVVLAALICVIASATAFGFHIRALKSAGGYRWAWLLLTGLVAGSGVWATHFIAMLAYQPSLQIQYELRGTLASLAVAVVGMGSGFALAVRWPGIAGRLLGGALTGLSVGAMHFMGIAAVRTQAHVLLDPAYVATSVIIGVLGGMAAFSLRRRTQGVGSWALPALALVLGIVGLHFTAMTAVTLVPDVRLGAPREVIDRAALVLATGGLATLILGAAGSLMWMERLGQRNTLGSLRGALNAVPAGLAFFDDSERLTVWNGAFAALMAECGIKAEAGQCRRAYAEAATATWIDGPAGTDAPVRPIPSEFQLPDGRWLRQESFQTNDGASVAVLSDITEQHRSAAAMANARDVAEAANRAKSEFLANMSHEIRTPLNGVLGIAEVLNGTRLSARQRELVRVIQQSGGLLNSLLTELLDLARIEAGAAELRPEPVRPGELAALVRDLFAARAQEKGLDLRLVVAPEAAAEVECDPVRLRQVLGNLLSNAIKFTEAGEVVLTVSRAGDQLSFEVRDTGAGFEPGQKAILFQRFGQADGSATRQQGGAGLGLAICNQYVGLMGGVLDCDSTPGEGSAFHFTLELPVRAPAVAAQIAPRSNGRFRLLIVDDNPVNRQILELILDNVGIQHASVEDGQQAIDAVMAENFDGVLMDIQMPVMDGLEATRRIRAWEAEGRRPRTPILIVSANCMQEHVDAGRTAGADGHLNKPIAVAELLAMLEPHMTHGAKSRAA